MRYSKRSEHYTGQPMFQILTKAQELERQGRDLVHFELGDPDFSTAPHIVEAGVDALYRGRTHYSPSRGEHGLLEAAAWATERSRGFRPSHDQLLVTPGANMQVYLALAATCDPGDSATVPVPYFPSYVAQCLALGIKRTRFPFGTRAVILNSPRNPSGEVLSKRELERVYAEAVESDQWIIADEVYSRMIWDGEFNSISSIDKCLERVILVNGFSKNFAMTGWRIGVVTGPVEVIRRMNILLETICSCVPQFVQDAATQALLGDQTAIRMQMAVLKRRRDIMAVELMTVPGLDCKPPAGGLYCWCKIENGMTSQEYADWALERGVVLSPGHIFGCDTHVRFSFATSEENIVKGMERLR